MFRDLSIVVDPPPNGVFTFEDTVTGKVFFESHRGEKLAWCYVFFHGWANTHVIQQSNNPQNQVPAVNYKDKDVLFQTSKKVYVDDGKTLQKKVRYEWPFQFDFRSEMEDAASLPSSGRYGASSVEYKVIAIPIPQASAANADQVINSIMNPNDQIFQKDAPINFNGMFVGLSKHLGAAADQELQFVKIRPEGPLDGNLRGPFSSSLEIGAHHLPQLEQTTDSAPERRGLFPREAHIPFQVDLRLPRNIVEGAYFPLMLSVTSRNRAWIENPPQATLVALKVHLEVQTITRASRQQSEHDSRILILDAKGLNVRLSTKEVDLGQIFPIRLTGDGLVPSFDTRLLTRKYDLSLEATVEIVGKQFHAKFLHIQSIELLSHHVAVGLALPPADNLPAGPKQKAVYQLKHSYIGRITQYSSGPIKEASIMEAALAVSRALTRYEVPHEFPGGSLVKILPYRFDRQRTNTSNFDKVTDSEKIHATFTEERSLEITPPQWYPEEKMALRLNYEDVVRGENMTIKFPTFSMTDDKWQKDWGKQTACPADAIKLDPVSLFNYRLSCAITHEKLSDAELGDFEGLYTSFSKDLHHHRKHIDVNAAKIAVERYPQIENVLADIGVDISRGKEHERMQAPVLDEGRGLERGYEEDLVKGMKKHSFFHRKH